MLKNKTKIIALLVVMILALTIPVVRATEETSTDVTLINEESNETTDETQDVTTITDDNFKKGDVYLTGDDVTIDYIVDGNLFVLANNVTINSQIGGDAFICAQTVTVGDQGYIFSNLFTFSQNVEIQGVVYDLYAAAQNVKISGYVYRDIRVGCDSLEIAGTVGRNAYIECSSLQIAQGNDGTTDGQQTSTITKQGMINGNLNYTSSQEANIPQGSVTGETNFTQKTVSNTSAIQDHIMSLGSIVVTAILIWLLCLWLAPKFLENTTKLIAKKPLPVIGLGIVTPIALILISIILLALGITSSLGLLLLALFFILVSVSTSIFIIMVNNFVCNKLKIQKNIGIFGMLIVTAIILWLIGLIPYIGSIIGFIAVIIGMGLISSHLFLKDDKVAEETK